MKDTQQEVKYLKESHEVLQPLRADLINLLLKNQKDFKNFLNRQVRNPLVAEDLLQQTFLKILERAGDLREDEKLTAWFYRILKNTLIDYYRSSSSDKRKQEALLQETSLNLKNSQGIPEELRNGFCQCIIALLPTLKTDYAELIRRIDLEEEKISEVAKDLKITSTHLSVRLHRARHALRLSLEKSCGACASHGCLDCSCK